MSIAAGQRQLPREDLAPFVPVTARLKDRDLGLALDDVKVTVARLGLPPTVRAEFGGICAQQQRSFTDLWGATIILSGVILD